jgi:alpha-tubulin suppressor-like RCC1 family protein
LGHGNCKNSIHPTQVYGSLDKKKVDIVSCGGLHTVGVTSDGYAHSFGYNKNG